MKKLLSIIGIALLAVIIISVVASSNNTNDVKTGGSNNVAKTTQTTASASQDDGSKKFNAALSNTFMGVQMNIAEVKISSDQIEVGMNLKNSSGDKMSFFPDQGTAVVGNLQLTADPLYATNLTSDGGDLDNGVKTDGVLVFTVPDGKTLDVNKVKNIQLHLGQLMDNKSYKSIDDVIINIPVK